jgi:4-phytase/acid phosphatase
MKTAAPLLLAPALLLAGASAPIAAKPAAPLTLERIVMVMRHGIRPPTKADPLPAGYTADRWPTWPVEPGLLTPRGAAGATLLGAGDARRLRARGLLSGSCPAPGAIVVKASNKQRTQRTAQAWLDGALPGCRIAVDHPREGAADPIFHGLDDKPVDFDGARALAEAKALLPRGGLAAETRAYRAELALLARVLKCAAPACPLTREQTLLVGEPHDRPGLEGPLDVGSSASQSLLLEYLEGMPMAQVGWGRVTRAQIERLLRFHPLKFKYSNRPDYVARAAAAPLVREILAGLSAPGRKVTLLAGHDTNLADLGGFLRTHWQVPSYPADDVPPGGAMGFELLRGASGQRYVRAFFRAQTMDQLRAQTRLVGRDAAPLRYLAIPGCGTAGVATSCTFAAFTRLARARLPS